MPDHGGVCLSIAPTHIGEMIRSTHVKTLTHRVLRDTFITRPSEAVLGQSASGGAMTYEKPEIRDLGSIAEHTYFEDVLACFNGGSGDYVKPVDL